MEVSKNEKLIGNFPTNESAAAGRLHRAHFRSIAKTHISMTRSQTTDRTISQAQKPVQYRILCH
jgi:hypothetical protein